MKSVVGLYLNYNAFVKGIEKNEIDENQLMYANLQSYDGAVLVYINDDGYQEDVCNNNLSTGIVEELAKLQAQNVLKETK